MWSASRAVIGKPRWFLWFINNKTGFRTHALGYWCSLGIWKLCSTACTSLTRSSSSDLLQFCSYWRYHNFYWWWYFYCRIVSCCFCYMLWSTTDTCVVFCRSSIWICYRCWKIGGLCLLYGSVYLLLVLRIISNTRVAALRCYLSQWFLSTS